MPEKTEPLPDSREKHNLPENGSNEMPPKVTIEIVKHKQLFDVLRDPKALWRVIASLFVIVVVLFIGLAFVVLVVKSFYPYNSIQTNQYGATIMKNEDKEVIYWLFNTAELWANSGITVKKNDRLTIRSSGASNTAIHYLVDATNEDRESRYDWVGTEGMERETERSDLRKKHRIAPDKPYGVLLMQIIPAESAKNRINWIKDPGIAKYIDGRDADTHIMTIGAERNEIVVPNDGVLHFAVNDIVMSDSNISDFYSENLHWFKKNVRSGMKLTDNTITDAISYARKQDIQNLTELNKSLNIQPDITLKSGKKISKYKLNTVGYGFGNYYSSKNSGRKDSCDIEGGYPLVNELCYYKEHKYRDPWYVDNVGSFLIVIERKTGNQ